MKRYRNALIFMLLPLLCITAALLFGRYSISLRDVLRAMIVTFLYRASIPINIEA